jgi:hypothetical protein
MIGQVGRTDAKGAEPLRDPIGSVIANEYSTAGSIDINHLNGRRLIGPEQ